MNDLVIHVPTIYLGCINKKLRKSTIHNFYIKEAVHVRKV